MIKLRGKDISMIFQDPMTSLNPTMQIGKQVMEPLIKHKNYSKAQAKKRALEILNLVGLPNAEKDLKHILINFQVDKGKELLLQLH